MPSDTTIDEAEIKKFQALADQWWDPYGKFKPLHMLNPCRLQYIVEQISWEFSLNMEESRPFRSLRLLDIGCGGGLLAEPMARLGANVVGADAAAANIPVAKIHAEQSNLNIDYRYTTAEELVEKNEKFDVILNMEVIEHVPEPINYIRFCERLLNPGGLMICSTINRNVKSFMYAIVGAEYIMKWLPKGTHEWKKFITPDELFALLWEAGLEPIDKKGFVFNKVRWDWKISETDLTVNYVTTSKKNTKIS